MATIATPVLRHVRKTITFDGTGGNGAAGTVNSFDLTGRFAIVHAVGYWTTVPSVTGTPTIGLGVEFVPGAILPVETVTNFNSLGPLWSTNGAVGSPIGQMMPSMAAGGFFFGPLAVTNDVFLTIAGGDVDSGVLELDVWGYPITDDGALTGDDASPASGMLGEAIEGAHTVEDLLRIIAAAVAGKVSGAEGNAPVFRDLNDTKDRIIAATTADGNRTAVSHDPS